MAGYWELMTEQLGIPLFLLVIIIIWSGIWKVFALWKAATKKSVIWFIVLCLVSTLGILDILYIFVFSKMKCQRKAEQNSKPARRKRRR